jgi:hypothetical protein
MAAFHSLVVGELPGMGRTQADNFLADFGLLGGLLEHSNPDISYGRWAHVHGGPGAWRGAW